MIKNRNLLQEELDVQSEERVLMVNVTTWDEEHSLEQNKAKSQFLLEGQGG